MESKIDKEKLQRIRDAGVVMLNHRARQKGRWIDRQDLLKLKEKNIFYIGVPSRSEHFMAMALAECWKNFINAIDDALCGIDIPEVKTSRWEISSDGYFPYCSNCHYEPPIGQRLTKYCPECGALMAENEEIRKETKESEEKRKHPKENEKN